MKWIIQLCFITYILCSCQPEEHTKTLFKKLSNKHTGIDFRNDLEETAELNILEYLYFYNGSGVSVEDINNDGLPDIYFGSNQNMDQLYLNLGNFQFKNISNTLPQEDLQGWTTGVNMVDINADGWMDIYVSRLTINGENTNKLFINQSGESFIEKSNSWGLDISGYCTHSSFFDYDNDGDLDCYILKHSEKDPDQFKPSSIRNVKDNKAGDLLLENVNNQYIDKTAEANIFSSAIGFGLGVSTADLNNDGWMDIYVCNDFHEQDYLYINNQDKTFTESISNATGHTSNFSMGCSIEDLNNDSQLDVLTLDMKPFDDATYKKSGGWENIQIYNYKRSFGYHHQSPRNALQINSGTNHVNPSFSEQACYFGVEASDWSWTPLVADFDNDGDKDIYISNGIVKRPNDMDFINFEYKDTADNSLDQIEKIPSGKVANIYYENTGPENKFKKIFNGDPSASTSAAYADLNLDGKLDIVINNINDEVSIIQNTQPENKYLRLKLKTQSSNINAVGAKVDLFVNGTKQTSTINSSNGFLSHNESIIHFGLLSNRPDSIIIKWPDNSIQKLNTKGIDTLIVVDQKVKTKKKSKVIKEANKNIRRIKNYEISSTPFNGQEANKWLLFNENSFGDKIYMHNNKLSIISPNGRIAGKIIEDDFVKNENEEWIYPSQLLSKVKNLKILFFESADQNLDGQEDFFIKTDSASLIFISNNEGYTELKLELENDVKSAVWEDINNDEKLELVIAGLWMPVSILNIFKNTDLLSYTLHDIPESYGWWLKVFVDDIDGDGNNDIIAGNFGTNHSLLVNNTYPIQAYESDFDKNGSTEKLITYYANGKEVPYPNQQLFVAQLPYVKRKFLKNKDFIKANIGQLIGENRLKDSKRFNISELNSCYFLNQQSWTKKPLPSSLQLAPLYAIEKSKNGEYYFGGNLFDVDPNLGRQDASFINKLRFYDNKWQANSSPKPPISGEIRSIYLEDKRMYYLDKNKGLFEYTF